VITNPRTTGKDALELNVDDDVALEVDDDDFILDTLDGIPPRSN